MVQLSQTTAAAANYGAEQLSSLWKDVTKDKMVQYKMRVDVQGQSKGLGQSSSS